MQIGLQKFELLILTEEICLCVCVLLSITLI